MTIHKLVRKIEKGIIYTLIALMTIVLVIATVELGYFVITKILRSDFLLIGLDDLMDVFGVFLLVLIGIELLDTIKVYLKSNVVHVEVVVLVAIIALARKVVVLKVEQMSGDKLLGISAMILVLAIAYYLIKKAGLMVCDMGDPEDIKDAVKKTLKEDINILVPQESIDDITTEARELVRDEVIDDIAKEEQAEKGSSKTRGEKSSNK
jgi:uncharacterized membrane protein (DUF373 family)